MRSFFHNKLVVSVLIVIGIVLVFAILSAYNVGSATPVANVASFVISPFEKVFSWSAEKIGNGIAYITEFDALKLENEELKAELLEKEELVREAEQYRDENQKLRALLNITRDNEQYTIEMCDIIARSDGDFSNVLTINKGSNAGIELGDTVMISEGYVGYVCELGVNWANVLTVTDSGLSVGAQNIRTKESMICEGDYSLMRDGKLRLSYLSLDTSLFVGDEVCTSGLSENVPQGIMIGKVSSISVAADGATKVAEVTPFVDTRDLTIVFVITDFENEG